jgi:hypothetical protein
VLSSEILSNSLEDIIFTSYTQNYINVQQKKAPKSCNIRLAWDNFYPNLNSYTQKVRNAVWRMKHNSLNTLGRVRKWGTEGYVAAFNTRIYGTIKLNGKCFLLYNLPQIRNSSGHLGLYNSNRAVYILIILQYFEQLQSKIFLHRIVTKRYFIRAWPWITWYYFSVYHTVGFS